MNNKFDNFLLSLLLGISTLLGLSFWLNIRFGFNLFYREHWNELAKLQASQTPIVLNFYISIIVAILIFIIGIYVIHMPRKKTYSTTISQPTPNISMTTTSVIKSNDKNDNKQNSSVPISNITMSRPPRLNLPTNMAQITAQRSTQLSQLPIPENKPVLQNTPEQNQYTEQIVQIFSDNGYLVKPNAKISIFTPNLFAIGPNEVLWIGAIDIKIEDIQRAVEKLQSVFTETLEDIKINITPFILDTLNKYNQNDSVLIFKTIDELKNFITENPAEQLNDAEQDNFNSYSEYIDTVLQYVKNI